jgi:hypothetical protein
LNLVQVCFLASYFSFLLLNYCLYYPKPGLFLFTRATSIPCYSGGTGRRIKVLKNKLKAESIRAWLKW